MFSHRTTFRVIFFFCAFQSALTAGIPWSRLTVEKIGTTRVTYKKEAWATADTAEALIALVSAPALAEAHQEQTNMSEFEYLFVNTAYFAAGAPVPPAVSGKKGGKGQPAVGPPAYEALNSDRVQNQLATLYEDYTAAYFVKNLDCFIDLFCKRIYGETVEGFKLDSPYFDEIKAFKLSFMGGKVSIYSFMILDEASDPDYENRMKFGYEISSLFPSSVPALLEQSAAGWAAIIESLKSSTNASSLSALLAKPATTTVIQHSPAPSGKKGKKKGSSAAASVQPGAIFSPEQTSAFLAEIEAETNKKKEAELKSKAAKEEQRRKQAEENEQLRLAKEAKLKKEAEDRELQRKLQSEAAREANKKKAEAKIIADEARMKEFRERERIEREQKERAELELQKQAEEQRIAELKKQKQEAELKRKEQAELKRKEQAELRKQKAELKKQQEQEADLKRQQDIELKKQQAAAELKRKQQAEAEAKLKRKQDAELKKQQAEIERLAQEERNRKIQEELIRARELQQAQIIEAANAERLRAEAFKAENEKLLKELEEIRRVTAQQQLLEQQRQRDLQQQIELGRRELQQQRLESQRQRELQQRQAQNDYDSIGGSTYSSPEDFRGSSGSSHSTSHFGSGSNRPVSLVQGASGPYDAQRNRYGNPPRATEAPMTINTDAPAFYPPAAGSFDSTRSFGSQNSMFTPASRDRAYSSDLQEVSPIAGLFGLGNSPFGNNNPALLTHPTHSPVFGSLTPQPQSSHVAAPAQIDSARSLSSIEEELLSADLMNAIDSDS